MPETADHRLTLAPYQRAALDEALSTDADGNYRYSVIVWSDIKKSIKSTIAAAVALWRACTTDWAQVLIIANDLKQADTRVGFYVRRAIELSPELKAACVVRNYKVTLPNHSTIEAIPIDPTGEAGSNADMVVYSELWGAHQEAQKRMWAETTLPPAKFGKSFRWVESYAGYIGESDLLEELYQNAVRDGIRLSDEVEMYRSRSGNIFALWNTEPKLPWQTPQYYASEREVLRAMPHEYLRLHNNQWVSSESSFITAELWDKCQDPSVKLDAREPLFIALDAGVSDDPFALIGTTVRPVWIPQGRGPARDLMITAPVVQLFEPPAGGTIDYGEVEAYLDKLRERQNIAEIAYDPFQLHDMAGRLEKKYGKILVEFSQGAERMQADRQLYNLIVERRMRHNGDTLLRQHVLNANAKTTGEYDKLRLVKKSAKLKIDLAVALSMSAWRALLHGRTEMGAEASGGRVTVQSQNRELPAQPGVADAPRAVPVAGPAAPARSSYVVVKRETKKPI